MKSRQARRPRARAAATVGELVRYGARRLAAAKLVFGHGTFTAREEAAYLVAGALGLDPARLAENGNGILPATRASAIRDLFRQRIAGRHPAAYLLGEAWFAGLRFRVDERVIVPRSHIATLIEDRFEPFLPPGLRIRSVLDLCTGSGCLAVLVARAFPRAAVDAADISRDALDVARINLRRYRLSRRVRLRESDLYAGLGGRRYDVIVSNPPYVTARAMRRLPPEYRREPPLALAGGDDGLAVVRRIVGRAREFLNPGGLLVVEVGAARQRVERAWPGAAFIWPEVAAGDSVFVASREQLPV